MKKLVGTLATIPLMIVPLMMAGGEGEDQAAALSGVPAEYLAAVMKAGSICEEITPSLIAAQIEAESGSDPHAVSPTGAQGIAQFMPGTWKTRGIDADGDGTADPFNPDDAIASQGAFMCALVEIVTGYTRSGQADGNTIDLALAAYNAGPGAVQQHGGIPRLLKHRITSHASSASQASTLRLPLRRRLLWPQPRSTSACPTCGEAPAPAAWTAQD